jgi:hypothetical protein
MKTMNLARALFAGLLSAIVRTVPRLMFVAALAYAAGMFATGAQAVTPTTLVHTWVASDGSDSANCDRPTPCLTFSGAYGKTTAGGEITCADSGNFGGLLNITQSITINCESSIASNMFASAINFIAITGTSVTVTLRGLDLDGGGFSGGVPCSGSNNGANVAFLGSGTLHLQKMKIHSLTGPECGVQFSPSGSATLDITDCDITDNGGSGLSAGIYVSPASGGTAHVSIDHSRINNNYFGIVFDGTQGGIIQGTISDSVVSNNTENGITASTTSSNVLLVIDQTKVSGNLHGLVAGGANAAMMVRNTTVTGNTAAGLFTVNGGQLFSYGDNSVDGNNGNNGAFTGMATLK